MRKDIVAEMDVSLYQGPFWARQDTGGLTHRVTRSMLGGGGGVLGAIVDNRVKKD